MKLRVKQNSGAIDSAVTCRVEWCNPQGVWFSFAADVSQSLVVLRNFGFAVRESSCFPGIYCCPWESSDDGDCYLVVAED